MPPALRTLIASHSAFFATTALALWIIQSTQIVPLDAASFAYLGTIIVASAFALIALPARQGAVLIGLLAAEISAVLFVVMARTTMPVERTIALAALAFVGSVIAIIVVFRTRPVVVSQVSLGAYVGFAGITALLAGGATRSALIAILAFVFLTGFLGLANYAVQLVLEHRAEMRTVWRTFAARSGPVVLGRSVILVFPAFALAAVGVLVYQGLETTLHTSIYEDVGIVRMDPSSDSAIAKRSLEQDLRFTVREAERLAGLRMRRQIDSVESAVALGLTATPAVVDTLVESFRPAPIPSKPCDRLQFRILRKRITFRSGCRALIADYNRRLAGAYQSKTTALRTRLTGAASRGETRLGDVIGDLRAEMESALKSTFADVGLTVSALFFMLVVTQAIGTAMLACGLIAAVQLVLGRVVFNAPGFASSGDGIGLSTHAGNTMQLEPGDAEPLEVKMLQQLPLDPSDLADSDRGWWVFPGIGRTGVGSVGRLSIPRPFTVTMSRLLTGRLWMYRIDPGLPRGNADPPVLTKDGDLLFVCIKVRPSQPITIRLQDVVAFSPSVRLQSSYTTHVSAHFLELGSFYCTARVPEGESGTIVLLSQGSLVACPEGPKCTPSYSTLAWDQRAKFGLAQSLSIEGVWFTEPFLVSRDRNAVIVDEGIPPRLQFLRRFWRLIRYMVLPF